MNKININKGRNLMKTMAAVVLVGMSTRLRRYGFVTQWKAGGRECMVDSYLGGTDDSGCV